MSDKIKRGDAIQFVPPSWRSDLAVEWEDGILMLEDCDDRGQCVIMTLAGEYITIPFDRIRKQKKTFRHEKWINVYPYWVGEIYKNRELADQLAGSDRIACVKVIIEGTEGEGLEED